MTEIVVSKKAHLAFKFTTVVSTIAAAISAVMIINLYNDAVEYKQEYEAASAAITTMSQQLSDAETEKKLLEKKLIETKKREKRRVQSVAHTNDAMCLARNIYFEAGNEPLAGKVAVAVVVKNRMSDPRFPKTACDVVYQGAKRDKGRCQFSWACDGIDNIVSVGSQAWKDSKRVATAILTGRSVGDVNAAEFDDALYFHNARVKPKWAKENRLVAVVGNHSFYR